jgi:hypothetical protein
MKIMKKVILMFAILAGIFAAGSANAQINISIQPTWGPQGYDYVNYYYIPDIEVYYCVPTQQFTWYNGHRWITSYDLPPRYAGYDLYGAYKVVLTESNPWYRHNYYRDSYYGYRGRHQDLIYESHDPRYYERRREHGYYGERRREEIRREEHREMRHEEHRNEIRRDEHRAPERRVEERRNEVRHEERRAPEHRNEARHEERRSPAPRHEEQRHEEHKR